MHNWRYHPATPRNLWIWRTFLASHYFLLVYHCTPLLNYISKIFNFLEEILTLLYQYVFLSVRHFVLGIYKHYSKVRLNQCVIKHRFYDNVFIPIILFQISHGENHELLLSSIPNYSNPNFHVWTNFQQQRNKVV